MGTPWQMTITKASGMEWAPVSLPAGALIFAFLWIRRFQIEIRGDEIRYTTLFSGMHSLRCSELERYEVGTNFRAHFGPPLRLTLFPREDTMKAPIVVNVKVFSRQDIKKLREILDANVKRKAPSAGPKRSELPLIFR